MSSVVDNNEKLMKLKEQPNINTDKSIEVREKTNTIDRYCIFVVSKYFETINDYINIEKTNKEYRGIIEQFKYNPIPFKKEKEREIFKNIDECIFLRRQKCVFQGLNKEFDEKRYTFVF